jgi:2',3'-cyclic-nucleotide 2'-phosphodiesterase (5'-nucleotidase family)
MKKTFIVIVALFIAALSWADQPFCILHINDLHSHLDPIKNDDGTESGGIARIATLVGGIKAMNEKDGIPTYFFIAGDAISGTPYSTVFDGAATFAALNEAGVDAMTLGNHEFDYGQKNLRGLMDEAGFPIISANVYESVGDGLTDFTKDYIVLGENPSILVIGLTTPETVYSTHPKNVVGLTFDNPAEVAIDILAEQSGKYEVAIGLTHLGVAADKKMAEGVPELNIIVGGHSHTLLEQPVYVGDTTIVQAGCYGHYVGRLDAVYTDAGTVEVSEYQMLPVTGDLGDNPKVEGVLKGYRERLGDEMNKVVATIPAKITSGSCRAEETVFGDVLTDVMRETSGADIAFSNGGGIRADLGPGDITIGDVLTALPFNNTIETATVTGEQLQEIFDYCAKSQVGGGGFLQVSGITVKYVAGKGAEDITVGGKPLDPAKEYKIATNDFLMAGGNDYKTLADVSNSYNTGVVLYEALVDYLKDGGAIPEKPAGRIEVTQ